MHGKSAIAVEKVKKIPAKVLTKTIGYSKVKR